MPSRDEQLLGSQFRKIQPKLRMFAKASDEVNGTRCEFASAMTIDIDQQITSSGEIDNGSRIAGKVSATKLSTPRLANVSKNVSVNTFVWRFSPENTPNSDIRNQGQLKTAKIRLSELSKIVDDTEIAYVELGEPLKKPDAIVSQTNITAPARDARNVPGRDNGGRGVLVGIIDVGGFDFSHEDFLDGEETRWIRIWDQKGGSRPAPNGFDYGSEITQSHMNAAIIASQNLGVPPWGLEPQSQNSFQSHGTHVASIAAGNRGVCRNAMIAGVLVDVPGEFFTDQKKSFYDSTRVAEAVTYLCKLAEELGMPLSINISLGTNGGGHDASSGASRWIDHELATPGRSVCVAAGNSGQEASSGPEDIGYIMGRIHTSGQIQARGLNNDIEWIVVGNGIADVSENELEIWYSGADRFAVSITPPGMPTIGPINPQEYVQNEKLADGSIFSVYNELYHPTNGLNYIAIYLSPFLKENPVVGVRPGLWRIRLHGLEVRDGRYHGWIERDDPRDTGIVGTRPYWNFPSFFSTKSNVDNSSVSSLACGERVISIANLDMMGERINPSSSQGPTRDGRQKPDVAAPGTDIVAANGFGGEEDSKWVGMTGTSMASPYVAGVIGLMLEAEPNLTAAQICGIIQRTSNPLPGANFEWSNDAGYGVLNPVECVSEARNLSRRVKLEQ